MAVSYKDIISNYKNLKKDEVIMPVAKDEDYELTSWSEWNKYAEESYSDEALGKLDKALDDAMPEATAQRADDLRRLGVFADDYYAKPAIHYTKPRHADTGKKIDWEEEAEKVRKELISIGGVEVKPEPEKKPRKPRYPRYKKDDRVNTPNGPGNVWLVDSDGTVCVELDNDPSILHEFERKELKKIK